MPLPSRHAHRRASFGDPLTKPRVPIDAEQDGEYVGTDLVTSDLVVGELLAGQAGALLCLSIAWG